MRRFAFDPTKEENLLQLSHTVSFSLFPPPLSLFLSLPSLSLFSHLFVKHSMKSRHHRRSSVCEREISNSVNRVRKKERDREGEREKERERPTNQIALHGRSFMPLTHCPSFRSILSSVSLVVSSLYLSFFLFSFIS
jgi:hypothetical protein